MLIKRPKRLVSLILLLFLLLTCCLFAEAASRNIQGAFSTDTAALLTEYRDKYGWSAEDSTVRTWEREIDGKIVTFERQNGYQVSYLKDILKTTRQYLGIYGTGAESWGAGRKGAASIVAVALAEVDNPESIEAPLGSNNVFYNTWFYGRSVQNRDANGDGVINGEDGAENYFPWSCVFISWCANECGFLDSGLYKKTSSCDTLYEYMVGDNGFDAYLTMDTTPFGGTQYEPVPGDLIFFEDPEGDSFGQVGIIVQVTDAGMIVVEGNYNSGVHKNLYSTSSGFMAASGSVVHVIYPTGQYDAEDNDPHPDIIFAFLTEQMGMTPAAACGALGNMGVESGYIPNIVEIGWTWESGGGFGLIQWTNTSAHGRRYEGTLLSPGDTFYYQDGLRRTNLVNYCVINGLDYNSLYGQLCFLQEEMNHYPSYSSAINRMNQCAHSLEGAKEACKIWLVNIEGIELMLAERQGHTKTQWESLVLGG